VKPLFGYGTFRRPAWRDAILGAVYPARAATLRGWRRTATGSGYLSIARAPDAAIAGVLIDLDAAGWAIADAWEDVPRYEHVAVTVDAAGAMVDAIAYVCVDRDAAVTIVADDDDRCALLDDAAVEAAIRRFRTALPARDRSR
jgi:gamma-glutamylcyclotransferase (GGCT)/AIG2-like uncharacterized protein YtfP